MISNILQTLQEGLRVMRLNSRLLLVGVLVFVFPILFVWVTQSFFVTSYANINTAEKRRVALLHDSLGQAVAYNQGVTDFTQLLINTYTAENSDIVKIRIVDRVGDEFVILQANDESLINSVEKSDSLYRNLPISASADSIIVETTVDNARNWQVFRQVELENNELYIFSEHSFALVDSIMSARRQQSYFGLTAIFLFLIALAYWLNKQISWEKHHAELQKQLESRDSFSNMIAHEFRSPLTAIKGYASFLEDSNELPAEEKRYASNIKRSADRLVTLVSDFLEVARLQSGKLSIKNSAVDVGPLVLMIANDLQSLAREKGLEVVVTPLSKPVHLHTDPARLTQVLTNIVTNAIKYTNAGMIEIECASIPGEVTIRVKDTGTGISADDQQKLFAPFTRVGGVDTSNITGSGLGMWITRQLVDMLGGTIGIESIKGIGTHVVMRFPNNQ